MHHASKEPAHNRPNSNKMNPLVSADICSGHRCSKNEGRALVIMYCIISLTSRYKQTREAKCATHQAIKMKPAMWALIYQKNFVFARKMEYFHQNVSYFLSCVHFAKRNGIGEQNKGFTFNLVQLIHQATFTKFFQTSERMRKSVSSLQ